MLRDTFNHIVWNMCCAKQSKQLNCSISCCRETGISFPRIVYRRGTALRSLKGRKEGGREKSRDFNFKCINFSKRTSGMSPVCVCVFFFWQCVQSAVKASRCHKKTRTLASTADPPKPILLGLFFICLFGPQMTCIRRGADKSLAL
jgi:hypothetical protein